MNVSNAADHSSRVGTAETEVRLTEVFSSDRIRINVEVNSTRRLFEIIAKLFVDGSQQVMNKDTVFRSLLEREQLGSTCVGNGVMIPHSRLHGLSAPLGAVVHLTTPLAVEADDNQPVFLACGLLVPAECSDLHIRILARLAEGFAKPEIHQRLREAQDETEIFDRLMQLDVPRR